MGCMVNIPGTDAMAVKPRRRWGLILAGGLLGLLVVAPLVQIAVLRIEVATESASARASALPSADAAHNQWLPGVAAGLDLAPSPTYSATYDVCFVDHTDGGWFPVSYNQNCGLHYVDFYELPKNNAAVKAAIKDARSSTTIGPHSSGMVFVPDYLQAAGKRKADTSGLPNTVWATLPGTSDARAATDEWMITDSQVTSYAAHDAFVGRTMLGEHGQAALDPAKQYLVVPDAHPYYAKVLGCSLVGQPLFCSSPFGGS